MSKKSFLIYIVCGVIELNKFKDVLNIVSTSQFLFELINTCDTPKQNT
jgi:hypothetical protein